MKTVFGWIVWALFFLWALNNVRAVLFGPNPHSVITNQLARRAMMLNSFIASVASLCLAIAFIYYDFSKFHLLWIGPLVLLLSGLISLIIGKLDRPF